MNGLRRQQPSLRTGRTARHDPGQFYRRGGAGPTSAMPNAPGRCWSRYPARRLRRHHGGGRPRPRSRPAHEYPKARLTGGGRGDFMAWVEAVVASLDGAPLALLLDLSRGRRSSSGSGGRSRRSARRDPHLLRDRRWTWPAHRRPRRGPGLRQQPGRPRRPLPPVVRSTATPAATAGAPAMREILARESGGPVGR